MIQSFRDKETGKLFHRERSKALPHDLQRVALRKLVQLDAATTLDDLKVPPGNRLEALAADRKGQHSIRVNDQFWSCFRWTAAEIVDFH